jgi:UDP-2,4-diacetamido-2,4,6-trideoxy-beta-L-altropyranose hydrolase
MTVARHRSLLFRVDGSRAIGSGHVMRSLALASAQHAAGGEACFVVASEAAPLVPEIRARRFPVHTVPADDQGRASAAADAEATLAVAARVGATACVVDGYGFPAEYYQALRDAGLIVAAIDDLGRALPAHVILNANYGAAAVPVHAGTELLLGPAYALLRPEFLAHPPGCISAAYDAPRGAPLRLLITFGGSDGSFGAVRVLDCLPAAPTVVATVAIGPAYQDRGELTAAAERAAGRGHVIELARASRDMAWWMARTDAAVCAAGCVLWELAYFGCPTLAFAVADDDEAAAGALARDGYTLGGGWLTRMADTEIACLLERLVADADLRGRLGRRFSELVDGRGAERALAALPPAVPTAKATPRAAEGLT